MKRRTLIDLIERDLDRDPGDAPALVLQDVIDLQDLDWMPEAREPAQSSRITRSSPASGW